MVSGEFYGPETLKSCNWIYIKLGGKNNVKQLEGKLFDCKHSFLILFFCYLADDIEIPLYLETKTFNMDLAVHIFSRELGHLLTHSLMNLPILVTNHSETKTQLLAGAKSESTGQ